MLETFIIYYVILGISFALSTFILVYNPSIEIARCVVDIGAFSKGVMFTLWMVLASLCFPVLIKPLILSPRNEVIDGVTTHILEAFSENDQ